mgnify:CR=1 FL=1
MRAKRETEKERERKASDRERKRSIKEIRAKRERDGMLTSWCLN